MKLLLTCPLGLESIAKKEIEMLKIQISQVKDKSIFFEGDEYSVAQANLWSRVGNKVYIVLDEEKYVENFDELYEIISKIPWKKYLQKNPVFVHAHSQNSVLESEPNIQKITKKAIADAVAWKDNFMQEDSSRPEIHIDIVILKNELLVLLDTTGEALHKRGYREEQNEAPIKENLAAGIVLLSGWKFKEPLHDPFCGSGTIVIEAVMIAKNIAPWRLRKFSYENFEFFSKNLKEKVIEESQKKVYDGNYSISGSDVDESAIQIARKNAQNAGVWDICKFEMKSFEDFSKKIDGKITVVSNPPYGDRLQSDEIDELYRQMLQFFHSENISGGIITNYPFDAWETDKWKRRKLYNWGKEVCFFRKIW